MHNQKKSISIEEALDIFKIYVYGCRAGLEGGHTTYPFPKGSIPTMEAVLEVVTDINNDLLKYAGLIWDEDPGSEGESRQQVNRVTLTLVPGERWLIKYQSNSGNHSIQVEWNKNWNNVNISFAAKPIPWIIEEEFMLEMAGYSFLEKKFYRRLVLPCFVKVDWLP